jgi:hypothetical protein
MTPRLFSRPKCIVRLRRIRALLVVSACLVSGCGPPSPRAPAPPPPQKPQEITSLQPETADIIRARRERLGWKRQVGAAPKDEWNSQEMLSRALGRQAGDTVLVAWCVERNESEKELQAVIVGEFKDAGVTLYSIARVVQRGVVIGDWKPRFIKGPPNFLNEAACPLPLSRTSFDWFVARCDWIDSRGAHSECGELAE